MAKQTINIGTSANSKDGDIIRDAFNKVNQNFDELYAGVDLSSVAQHILPATNETYDLGSASKRWRSLYVSENTVYFGSKALSINNAGGVEVDGVVIATPGGAQANADWNATTGSAQILNKPTIPTNTNQLTNGAGFITETAELVMGSYTIGIATDGRLVSSALSPLIVNSDTAVEIAWTDDTSPVDSLVYSGITVDNSGVIVQTSDTIANSSDKLWRFDYTGKLTFPDGLTLSDSVISRRVEEVVDDGITITTDAIGAKLTLTNNSIAMESYADPDGPNNIQYSRISAGPSELLLRYAVQDVGGEVSSQLSVASGLVYTFTDGVVTNNFSVAPDGIVTLANSSYLEPTSNNLNIGAQGVLSIRSNALTNVNTREWTFDKAGTINTPLMLPVTFTAVLDSAHMSFPDPAVALTDTPWQFEVQFQVNPDGSVQTVMDSPFPNLVNPGYVSGYTFVFLEADHGIPGYVFSLSLDDVILPGGAGWTANPAVSPPPSYPSTIASAGAVKLTASDRDFIFGTDGNLTLTGGAKITANGGSIDLVAGTNGYAELASNSGDNYVWVDDGGAYIGTTGGGSFKQWTFAKDGRLRIDNSYALAGTQNSFINAGSAPTVAYTSLDGTIGAVKATIKVVTTQASTLDGDYDIDTQICEMLVTTKRRYLDNGGVWIKTAVASVYGVTHTSDSPLAIFTVNYVENFTDSNGTRDVVQILAEPTAAMTGTQMWVMVAATEMTND